MSVGILLLSHNGIASSLLNIAKQIWQSPPDNIDVLEVKFDVDTEKLSQTILEKTSHLDQGDGVLMLTDLVGATPCNLAAKLCNDKLLMVTGLNLPMLLRSCNYVEMPLTELADKAIEGGIKSIGLIQVCNELDKEPVFGK